MKTVTCKVCGITEELHWDKRTETALLEHSMCFTCNFWREKVAIKDDPRVARIDGVHFIGEDGIVQGIDSSFLGHGGSKFTIQFNDGRKITTNNLWCQGRIPEIWKAQLPDNAKFL